MTRSAKESLKATTMMDVLRKTAQIVAENWGIQVIFKGDLAYTDGRTIVVPALPEGAPDDLVEAIIGFIDHEVGHVRHTDMTEKRPFKDPDKRVMPVTNAIEDIRQEFLMSAEYRGIGLNLERCSAWALAKLENKWEKLDPLGQLTILAMCRAKALQEHPVAQIFCDKFEGSYAPILDRLQHEIEDWVNLPSTSAAYEAAKRFLGAIDDMCEGGEGGDGDEGAPKLGKPKEGKSGKGKGDGSGKGKPQKSSKGEGEGQSDSKPGSNSASSGSPKGSKEQPKSSSGSSAEKPEDKTQEPGQDDVQEGSGDSAGDEAESDEGQENTESEDNDGENNAGDDNSTSDGGSESGEEAQGEQPGNSAFDLDEDHDEPEGDKPSGGSGDPDESDGESSAQSGDQGGEDTGEDQQGAGDSGSDGVDEGSGDNGSGSGSEEGGEDAGLGEASNEPLDERSGELAAAIATNLSPSQDSLHEHTAQFIKHSSERLPGYRPFTTEYDLTIKPIGDGRLEDYGKQLERVRPFVNAVYTVLTRTLLAETRARNFVGLNEGHPNSTSMARLRVGQGDVFKRKKKGKELDTYVEVIVDHSGSMDGHKIRLAQQTCIAICEALERVSKSGLKYGISGFTAGWIAFPTGSKEITEAEWERRLKQWSKEYEAGKMDEFERIEPLIEFVYKTGDEPLSKVRPLLSLMCDQPMGNNADGESIYRIAKRVMQRREKRKILIVLSDGQPVASSGSKHSGDRVFPKHMQHVADMIKHTKGLEVIGIGIHSDAVEHYYEKRIVVNKIEELPNAALTQLKNALMGKGEGRKAA